MFKRKKQQPIRLRVRYELPHGDGWRGYESEAEIVVHGDDNRGLTQAIAAIGQGLLDMAQSDSAGDWRHKPRFGNNGDGGTS